MERKATLPVKFEIKEVETKEDGTVKISGFASTPDIDRYDDIVRPKAFVETMEQYMKNPVVLLQHDSDRPIGKVVDYSIGSKGLKVTAEITEDTDGVIWKIQKGIMGAFSIGFIPLDWAIVKDETLDEPRELRMITKLDLVEISVVSTPANANALFSLAKSVKAFFDSDEFANFTTNQKNMEIFAKLLASLESKEIISSEEIALIQLAYAELSEEAQAECKESLDKIVAKEVEAEEPETPAWETGGDEGEAEPEGDAEPEAGEDETPSEGEGETPSDDEKALEIAELKAQLEAKDEQIAGLAKSVDEVNERLDGFTSRKSTVSSGTNSQSGLVAYPELIS